MSLTGSSQASPSAIPIFSAVRLLQITLTLTILLRVHRIANSHGSHMALHQQQQQQQVSAAAASQQLHHQQAQHPAALQTTPSTASSGQLPAPSGASGHHSQQLAHAESGGVQSSSGGASGDVDMPMAESGPDFGSPGNPIVVQVLGSFAPWRLQPRAAAGQQVLAKMS